MTVGPISLCASCARLGPRADGEYGVACAAFPEGIPDAIWIGGADHRRPIDGDGGVLYEPDPTQSAALLAYEAARQ